MSSDIERAEKKLLIVSWVGIVFAFAFIGSLVWRFV